MKKFIKKYLILVLILSFASCEKLEKEKSFPKFVDYYNLYDIESKFYLNDDKVYFIKSNILYIKNLIKDEISSFNLPFNSLNYYVFDANRENFIFISNLKPKIYIYSENKIKEFVLKENLPYINFIKFYKDGLIYYDEIEPKSLKILDKNYNLIKTIKIDGDPIKNIGDEIYLFNNDTLIKLNLKTEKEERFNIDGIVKDIVPNSDWVIVYKEDNLFFFNILTKEVLFLPNLNNPYNSDDVVQTDGEFVLYENRLSFTLSVFRYLFKEKNINFKENDETAILKRKLCKNLDDLELYEKIGDLYFKKKDFDRAFFFYQCKVLNSKKEAKDELIRWLIKKRIDFIESEFFNKGSFENYPFIIDNLIIKYLDLIDDKNFEDGKMYFRLGEFSKALEIFEKNLNNEEAIEYLILCYYYQGKETPKNLLSYIEGHPLLTLFNKILNTESGNIYELNNESKISFEDETFNTIDSEFIFGKSLESFIEGGKRFFILRLIKFNSSKVISFILDKDFNIFKKFDGLIKKFNGGFLVQNFEVSSSKIILKNGKTKDVAGILEIEFELDFDGDGEDEVLLLNFDEMNLYIISEGNIFEFEIKKYKEFRDRFRLIKGNFKKEKGEEIFIYSNGTYGILKFNGKELSELENGEIDELKSKIPYSIYVKDLNGDGLDEIILGYSYESDEESYRNFLIFTLEPTLKKVFEFKIKDILVDKEIVRFKDIDNDNLADLIICGIDYIVLGYRNGEFEVKEKIENFGGERTEGIITELDGNIFVTGNNTIIFTKDGKRIDIKKPVGYGYLIQDKIYSIKGRFYRTYAGSGKFGILNGPIGVFTFDGKEILNSKETYFRYFKKVGNYFFLIDVLNRGFIFDKDFEPIYKIPLDEISVINVYSYNDKEILIFKDSKDDFYVFYNGLILKLNEYKGISDLFYIHPYIYISYKNEVKIYNLESFKTYKFLKLNFKNFNFIDYVKDKFLIDTKENLYLTDSNLKNLKIIGSKKPHSIMSFSNNFTKLLFIDTYEDDLGNLYILDLEKNEEIFIDKNVYFLTDNPHFSLDDRFVVYSTTNPSSIKIYDIKNKTSKKLTYIEENKEPYLEEMLPYISKDSNYIIFISNRDYLDKEDSSIYNVFYINLEDGNMEKIPVETLIGYPATMSFKVYFPDFENVLINIKEKDTYKNYFYIFNFKSKEIKKLDFNFLNFSISQDGRKILGLREDKKIFLQDIFTWKIDEVKMESFGDILWSQDNNLFLNRTENFGEIYNLNGEKITRISMDYSKDNVLYFDKEKLIFNKTITNEIVIFYILSTYP